MFSYIVIDLSEVHWNYLMKGETWMSQYNDLVTVVVPVYNVEDDLPHCMETIIGQTYPHLEIIMVDDGSTDSSGKLCDEIAQTDSRIRVIHQENAGLSAARNTGIEHADKEGYFLFVDSDDSIVDTMVEDMLEQAKEHDADIVICGLEWMTPGMTFQQVKEETVEVITGYEALRRLERVYYVVQWNKLFKKKIFDDLRYPVGMYHEDEYIAAHEFYVADTVVCMNKKLYIYNAVRENSITRTLSGKRLKDVSDAFEHRLQFFKEIGRPDCIGSTVRVYVYHLVNCMRDCSLLEEKDQYLPIFQKRGRDLIRKYPKPLLRMKASKIIALFGYTYFYSLHGVYRMMMKISRRHKG